MLHRELDLVEGEACCAEVGIKCEFFTYVAILLLTRMQCTAWRSHELF